MRNFQNSLNRWRYCSSLAGKKKAPPQTGMGLLSHYGRGNSHSFEPSGTAVEPFVSVFMVAQKPHHVTPQHLVSAYGGVQ
jgi:hypothetical protein